MAWACRVVFVSGGTLVASVTAPLLGDLLCFCSMAASRPLLLAYLLFFSPYLLAALSFLGPLLISTCFLLLSLLTVSPYLSAPPPPPPSPPPPPATDGGRVPAGPFCNTLHLVLGALNPSAGGETKLLLPPPEALCGIAAALQACVDSVEEMYRDRGEAAAAASEGGSPGDDDGGGEEEEEAEEEEKRIVAEAAAPGGAELFGWELEAISKLYRALTYEVEEFPVKLALQRGFKEDELFPPEIGVLIQGGDRKLQQSGEPGEDLPRKEPPCSAEFQGRKVDIPLRNASKSAIKSRDGGGELLEYRNLTGETSSPPKRSTPRSKGVDPQGKLLQLRRSSSSSSTTRAAATAAGLSRVASARGWSAAAAGATKGAPQLQALSSCGSMRKEKEWRRTLACKLFEERMVAEGGEEGMDLLWETYEQGSGKVDGDDSSSSKKITSHSSHDMSRGRKPDSAAKAKRSGELHGEEDNDGEEEEEEEASPGRLCCLQALRFSTAKMGLGMGRSGLLLKVSKAMKGVGAFRRRAAPRSSRKTG